MVDPVEDTDFAAAATSEPTRLVVMLSGCADIPSKPLLDRFLRQVHEEARARGVHEVKADIRKLEFMDSSCIKALVWWVMTVNESSCPLYRITFVSDSGYVWQRRSLGALSALVPDGVSVVVAV